MLIDDYLPAFDVRDYHETRVAADPAAAYAAFHALDLERSRMVRLLFALRGLPARFHGRQSGPARPGPSRPFLDSALEMGWEILEEAPGQELVVGAVTQPWAATVKFRGLAPSEFLAYAEPGFTKIVWNIAARAGGAGHTILSTETRVLATDPKSRRRFQRYWLVCNPGIRLIRRIALSQVRRELGQFGRASSGREVGGIMRPATWVTTIFLALVALLHLLRVALSVPVTVGSANLPMWMSVAACLFTGGLAIVLWRENHR